MSSQYERERLAKIERNKSRLAALGLNTFKIGADDSQPPPPDTPTTAKKKAAAAESTPASSEKRTSSRLKDKQPVTYAYKELAKRQQQKQLSPASITPTSKKKHKKSVTPSPATDSTVRRRRGYSERVKNQQASPATARAVSPPPSGRRHSERLAKKRRTSYHGIGGGGDENDDGSDVEHYTFSLSDGDDDEQTMATTRKTLSLTPSSNQHPSIMFTSEISSKKYEKIIRSLGGTIEYDDISKATHLISAHVKRSIKHLCAIGRSIHILTEQWFTASKKSGYWLEEAPFLLRNGDQRESITTTTTTETETDTDTASSSEHQPVFQNQYFFVTDSVVPPKHEMEQVIVCSGGVILTDFTSPSLSAIHKQSDDTTGIVIHVISCEADLSNLQQKCWKQFCAAKVQHERTKNDSWMVHEPEYVLSSVFNQSIDLENQYLIELSLSEEDAENNDNDNNNNDNNNNSEASPVLWESQSQSQQTPSQLFTTRSETSAEKEESVAKRDENEQSSAEIA